jgi:hypothetical protein
MRFSSGTSGDKRIINKHGARGNEAVVSDRDEVTDECVRLNPAPLADVCPLLDLNEWTNKSVISNGAPIQINWLNYRYVFTERYINNTSRAQLRLIHEVFWPFGRKGRARSTIETTVRA